VIGLLALANPETESLEMTKFTLGALLTLAPWMFGYSHLAGATGDALAVGVMTVITSLWGDVICQFHGELEP
jgi:hypothetical protein